MVWPLRLSVHPSRGLHAFENWTCQTASAGMQGGSNTLHTSFLVKVPCSNFPQHSSKLPLPSLITRTPGHNVLAKRLHHNVVTQKVMPARFKWSKAHCQEVRTNTIVSGVEVSHLTPPSLIMCSCLLNSCANNCTTATTELHTFEYFSGSRVCQDQSHFMLLLSRCSC